MRNVIQEKQIKLCIIDPISLALQGDQNDYNVMRSLINAICQANVVVRLGKLSTLGVLAEVVGRIRKPEVQTIYLRMLTSIIHYVIYNGVKGFFVGVAKLGVDGNAANSVHFRHQRSLLGFDLALKLIPPQSVQSNSFGSPAMTDPVADKPSPL